LRRQSHRHHELIGIAPFKLGLGIGIARGKVRVRGVRFAVLTSRSARPRRAPPLARLNPPWPTTASGTELKLPGATAPGSAHGGGRL
jgi:hypothetical protein